MDTIVGAFQNSRCTVFVPGIAGLGETRQRRWSLRSRLRARSPALIPICPAWSASPGRAALGRAGTECSAVCIASIV